MLQFLPGVRREIRNLIPSGTEIVDGPNTLKLERRRIDLLKGLNVGNGLLENLPGLARIVITGVMHRPRHRIHANDVRFELQDGISIFLVRAVELEQCTDPKIVLGVAYDALKILELEEQQVTVVVEDSLVLHESAIVMAQLKPFIVARRFHVPGQSNIQLSDHRLAVERALSIRPAIELVLLNAKGLPHLENVSTVLSFHDPHVVIRLVGPIPKKRYEVKTHLLSIRYQYSTRRLQLSVIRVYDHRAMSNTTVMSLGGSIVVPNQVDIEFVNSFVNRMQNRLKHDAAWRLALVVGGGATARVYQQAARIMGSDCPPVTQDRIGIAATRINAEVVRAAFGRLCPDPVITDPTAPGPITGKVVVAGGWKPGFSTDNVAIRLAESLDAMTVINLSNIRQIYTADPKTNANAEPLTELSWDEFFGIAGEEWIPGKNTPFDPVASRRAAELGMKVIVADGRDLDNLDAILEGDDFLGSTIGPG